MAFDKFFFGFDDDVEDVGKYKPGGYHPVHLGDILPKKSTSSREPRYRIIQKLGHGVFGTVWLARDLLGSLGYVAVKINVSRITGKSNETRILRWLRDSNHHGQPGYDNIVGLLDDFTIRGPNGTHECLVTEVVARLRDLVDDATFPTYTREISFQVLSGLAYLHNQGVTHGDFHFGNIGICIPQLQELSEEQLLDFLMNQTSTAITPVIPRDPLDQSQSLPAYVIPFINLVTFLKFSLGTSARFAPIRVKILDFGNAFRQSDQRPPPNTPIEIRAPEVTFNELSRGRVCSDWNLPIDIWAAAITLHEVNFNAVPISGMCQNDNSIYRTLQMAGPPPASWEKYWDLNKFCAKSGKIPRIDPEDFWAKQRDLRRQRKRGPTGQEADQLYDLLRSMLKTDPHDRPRIGVLLNHPWFGSRASAANNSGDSQRN